MVELKEGVVIYNPNTALLYSSCYTVHRCHQSHLCTCMLCVTCKICYCMIITSTGIGTTEEFLLDTQSLVMLEFDLTGIFQHFDPVLNRLHLRFIHSEQLSIIQHTHFRT